MWYVNSEKKGLDYSKPICAISKTSDSIFILVPSNQDESYDFRGFDWLNIKTGKYNSCRNFTTVGEAIKPYLEGYNIVNCDINLKF